MRSSETHLARIVHSQGILLGNCLVPVFAAIADHPHSSIPENNFSGGALLEPLGKQAAMPSRCIDFNNILSGEYLKPS